MHLAARAFALSTGMAVMAVMACGAQPDAASAASSQSSTEPAHATTSTPGSRADEPAPEPAQHSDAASGDPMAAGEASAESATEADAEPTLPLEPQPATAQDANNPVDAARLERSGELGRDLVSALRAGRVDAALALTPYGEGPLSALCDASALADGKREALARVRHCVRSIAWDKVTDVRISGGEATGAPAQGCTAAVMGHDRVTMLVLTSAGNHEIELRGVVGREGKAEVFSGAMTCSARGR